jgi:thiosulfate/3-mercaptopyruvate sulfurtransferase
MVSFDEEGQFKIQSGKSAYEQKHIPNALFADLLGNLSAHDSKLNFVMPSAEQFQKAMSDLGVSNNSRVVIYSTKPKQSWAQRLWWMLKWAGHDNTAVLDGGLKAWTQAGFAVSDKQVNRQKTHFKLNLNNKIIAEKDEVLRAITNQSTTIIDALSKASYNGDFSMYSRPGHIKSAINTPTDTLFLESGQFKPVNDLRNLFKSNKDNRVITYCGGGVAATSVAFSLYRLGYKDVAVYMGSLQEWVTDDKNPMSQGDNK